MTHEEALAEKERLEKMIADNPQDAEAYISLGWLSYKELQNYSFAKLCFNKVLEFEPNNIKSLFYLGLLYQNHFREYENAKLYYEKVIQLSPRHSSALNNLALILTQFDFNFIKARDLFSKAITLNSNTPHIWQGFGRLFNLTNNPETEADCYRRKKLIEDGKSPFSEDLIQKNELESFITLEKGLPYTMSMLRVRNYQGIVANQTIEIGWLPNNLQWIFFTGENGYGKTTILQAITIGLRWRREPTDEPEENHNLLDSTDSPKIELVYKDPNGVKINCLDRYDFEPVEPVVAYGPIRLMGNSIEFKKLSNTYTLFNSDHFLFDFENWLKDVVSENTRRFEKIRGAVLSVMKDYISDIHIATANPRTGHKFVYYTEREHDGHGEFPPVRYHKLSAGFKSVLALVCDMIYRLGQNQPDFQDPADLEGIVLIDELENHLHPRWQRELPTLLSNAFPKVQFIASTHSIVPILGAPKESAVLRVSRSKESGIAVERLDYDFTNMNANLLLDIIFDVDSTPKANNNLTKMEWADTKAQREALQKAFGSVDELLND